MAEPPWSQYDQAFKRIHDKLVEILTKLDQPADPQTVEIIASIVLTVAQQTIRRILQYPEGTDIDPRDRNWTITEAIDISDRATRDLGKVDVVDIEKSFSEADVYSGEATSAGDTEIKAAEAALSFEVSSIFVWNNGTADITVAFRFGSGPLRYKHLLAPKTGWGKEFIRKWKGGFNTPFYINLSSTGTVSYTVLGEMT